MEQSIKQRQVAALIQQEFSAVLQQEGVYIYGEALVTVTHVRMSADMGIAYIYLSVYNTLYKQEVIKEMWEHLSRLRGELGKRIRKQVRHIPRIKFFIDDSLDEAEHLDKLFAQMNGKQHVSKTMKEAQEEKNEKNSDDQQ